ncbi:MAG: methyl-accepting chemotaxis protein [Lachnospiraceae bacterium]|nr:methyl-accepting chemotaxis protein [Lachnospiraceae bacterium]
MGKKRKSLKKSLLSSIIVFVVIIVVIITQISIKLAVDNIQSLLNIVLARENIAYSNEVSGWWNGIEQRVSQTANVYRNSPEMSYDETRTLLEKLTADDPDSQDVYMGFEKDNTFIDGSGWVPDETFVFNDRVWYKGAVEKKGEMFSSDPYLDASTGKTCLACSVLIKDGVVLSSDINFDKVSEKLQKFESYADDATFYIVNKSTKEVLVSSNGTNNGEKLSETSDDRLMGLASVFDQLDKSAVANSKKVVTSKSKGGGSYMYTATDITGTSWAVVSAVPAEVLGAIILKVMIITFVSAIILLGIFSIIVYLILSKAINPVNRVTERIADISKGDFTVKLVPEGNNEITTLSESLNEYIEKMRVTLQSLSSISGNMNTRAGECFDISHTLANANNNQGESIEQLNSTLNGMNSSIEKIAMAADDLANTSNQLTQSASDVKNLCQETMNSSTQGRDEMQSMTQNVETLNATINELTALIRSTAKSVEEITGITDTINAISEQTNLLSLNASIEAARAGEMGRGFEVVASEVGALANQSTEATKNIRDLIEDITKNIADINNKADICVKDMEECVAGVDHANNSFNKIYTDVAKATDGIVKIANGIDKISDVASGNAATTREQAQNINSILELSDRIVNESNKLRAETVNITNISENLNQYSDEINSDLSQYVV